MKTDLPPLTGMDKMHADCKKKIVYLNFATAERRAAEILQRKDRARGSKNWTTLRPYKCLICGMYHLTHL